MAEMKSALERALERAEQLGKLSPEEMQRKKEEEYIPVGEGLAKRYLEHGYRDLLAEGINKYNGEEKAIITQAVLSTLVQSIELEDSELTERALQGILSLRMNERIENMRQGVENILSGYHQTKQERHEVGRAAIERSVRESLHRMRISGSAVGEVNAETGEAWRRIVGELQSEFGARLSELKKSLTEALD